ncbi:right-handed parallel beta-helix repeat-containing protein [uncultured Friedmanniella sp.]|uniref:right-handed parallel beta-helix repeat-containing protein n=1 Tax=uncultured Friedmanniella sp. TaxID=335381 RepID=UPI0035C99888
MPSFFLGARPRWAGPVAALASTLLASIALAAAPTAASAATTVVTDGFDRGVTTGWGAAPTGGSWAVRGGKPSVSGGIGIVSGVTATHSFRAVLKSTKVADVTTRATFVVPTGKQVYYASEARRQTNDTSYGSRARIDGNRKLHVEVVRYSGGTATILAQKLLSTVSAGQVVSVELSVSGSSRVSVRGKAYVSGTLAPDWQANATDTSSSRISAAGSIAVSGYVGPGNSAQKFSTTSLVATAGGAAAAPTTPATPATPTPAPTSAPATTSHGAATIGTTGYAVPSNAVFVSASGSDSSAGSKAAPVKTVTRAISKTAGGGTVVIRGGSYHEYFIVPPGKNITIQSYPGEAVWFDGASTVSGFQASGSAWRLNNWTSLFDASPTYTKGAPDGTAVGWSFLDPAYPMAAHPDAVWIDGAEQKQVGALSQVKAGTFYVDTSGKRLYLGTNPSGRSVAASTLSQAVSLRAPGTTIRGIGFRRYADSVPQQGVITTYYPNQHLENVEVRDSATAGIGIFDTGSTLKNVTISGSGQIGLQANKADNLVVDNVAIRNSNDQHFNAAPSAGGLKVTTTRGFTLQNSEISGTFGNQFWADQSMYGVNLLNNTITGGSRWGVVLEISSTATIANNVISGNAYDGLIISDTDNVQVWNNTIVSNGRAAIAVVQDSRRITQLNVAGHDNRRAQPDRSMPWISRNISVGNNILSGGTADKSSIFHVEGYDRVYSGEQMVTYSNGNVFSRVATGTPKYAAVWGNAGAYATTYGTLADYQKGTGRDGSSYSHVAAAAVNSAFQPVSAISSRDSTVAQALPSGVATKIGKTTGAKHLGAWR